MANAPTISLVIATVSRPTLARSLNSLVGQDWREGDEVLVIGDGPQPVAKELCGLFAKSVPIRYLENPGQTGMWGHHPRNWVLDKGLCRGDYLMALDDDDEYTEDAIRVARQAFAECPRPRPHVFRMSGHPAVGTVWKEPVMRAGNLGTPCLALPNDPTKLGRYGLRYAGDFDFAESTCAHYSEGPVWREEVVCRVRPHAR